jgi:inward rectifier potassium channel
MASTRIRLQSARRFPRIQAVGNDTPFYEDFYFLVLTMSWPRFLAVGAMGFLAANGVFALLYLAAPGSIANARPGSFEDAFFFSVQTMATIGYGVMAPGTLFAHVLVTLEAMIGVVGLAVVTGLTFARFSRPRARVLFTEKMVINHRDGVPHLLVRMANFRHNQILEARLSIILLLVEHTAEGESFRRPVELPLVRDHTAFFNLTWTAMHRIDEASPFHGPDALARLRAARAEILLTLTGYDETLAQNVHARWYYELDDVVWNARFADVITVREDGTRVVDYGHFHELVPLEPVVAATPGA